MHDTSFINVNENINDGIIEFTGSDYSFYNHHLLEAFQDSAHSIELPDGFTIEDFMNLQNGDQVHVNAISLTSFHNTQLVWSNADLYFEKVDGSLNPIIHFKPIDPTQSITFQVIDDSKIAPTHIATFNPNNLGHITIGKDDVNEYPVICPYSV
jgi:hypothetical protein